VTIVAPQCLACFKVHMACVCRFVLSTPERADIENEVHVLADNLKSLRSMGMQSPVSPSPSDRASRSVFFHMLCKLQY